MVLLADVIEALEEEAAVVAVVVDELSELGVAVEVEGAAASGAAAILGTIRPGSAVSFLLVTFCLMLRSSRTMKPRLPLPCQASIRT